MRGGYRLVVGLGMGMIWRSRLREQRWDNRQKKKSFDTVVALELELVAYDKLVLMSLDQ